MEPQDKIAHYEATILNLVEGINNQADYMGSVVQFIDYVKQYIRASRMMATVCLAGATMDSETERDMRALSHCLADIEIWAVAQDQVIRDRHEYLAQVNTMLQAAVGQGPATTEQAQALAADQSNT